MENLQKTYVRCGACNGIALIQNKAAYADHQALPPRKKETENEVKKSTQTNALMMMNASVGQIHTNPATTATITPPPFRGEMSKPPAFLMKNDNSIPMPIQFATRQNIPITVIDEGSQKLLRTAVGVAMIVAVLSGFYLFAQGKKIIQGSTETSQSSAVRTR